MLEQECWSVPRGFASVGCFINYYTRGGAFSGKDPTKVDRSAAYICRQMAKSVVSSGLSARCLVQLSYAIGVAKPLSLFVETYGSEKTGLTVNDITSILKRLGCLNVCLRQSKSKTVQR